MYWREVQAEEETKSRFALIGDPPDADLLFRAYSTGFKSLELPTVIQLDCPDGEFYEAANCLKEVGLCGIAVGNPHKAIAANMAKRFYIVKHGLGVANALDFRGEISAQNTEVPAFVNFIRDVETGTALVMGSGRAARSAVMGLFECGWQVKLWNRNILRSRPFVTLFERYGEVHRVPHADPTGCTMIVNATPLGRKAGEQPPLIWNHVKPKTVCVDYVYRNVPTEFLRMASLRGFRAVDGRELLAEQSALAIQWWTGKDPDREKMRDAVGLKPQLSRGY